MYENYMEVACDQVVALECIIIERSKVPVQLATDTFLLEACT